MAGGEPSQPPGVGAELPRGLGGWVLRESSGNRYNGSGEHCHEIKYMRKICMDIPIVYRELKITAWIRGGGGAPPTADLEGMENREYIRCSRGSVELSIRSSERVRRKGRKKRGWI